MWAHCFEGGKKKTFGNIHANGAAEEMNCGPVTQKQRQKQIQRQGKGEGQRQGQRQGQRWS